MYWWPVGHYLQGAGQAWSGQPGILIQGISCFQVQPFVLSLQELVGCHYGQWSTLSKSRASSGAVETASSHMQQQEQRLQDDHFCMGRAAPNLDGYRPKGGSQMQATGMYGEMQIASDLKQPQSSQMWQNTWPQRSPLYWQGRKMAKLGTWYRVQCVSKHSWFLLHTTAQCGGTF
jgi:hypothetical protein